MRQLRDWKVSVRVEQMMPQGWRLYGRLCGWTLARAHARSGDRIAIAAYLGVADVFDRAIAEFAEAYADQNEPITPHSLPPSLKDAPKLSTASEGSSVAPTASGKAPRPS